MQYLAVLLVPVLGCGEDARNIVEKPSMSTDLVALKRFIQLPAEVTRCEWQTGQFAPHGGDWWVAAVLDVPADQLASFLQGPAAREAIETPPGLSLVSSFAALRSLPHAQPLEADRLRVVIDTHGIAPYARSPLLNGKAIRLSATQVLVLAWTQ